MIPVLIVPFLRPDLVGQMVASVDVPVGRWIALDNGNTGTEVPGVIHLPANLGVAASWNLGIKLTIDAPWWCIVNDDVVFAPGDLARLEQAMGSDPMLVTLDGFSAFGVNAAAIATVGWFDENYHPAYCEDADYEYRCRLTGVPIVAQAAGLQHRRSSTIAEPRWAAANARTYPANRAYYRTKWGGELRGGETLQSPLKGGVRDWTLDFERLRDQAWDR